jgi:hypothetical protein
MQVPREYLSTEMVSNLEFLASTVKEKKIHPELSSWFLDRSVTFSKSNNALLDSIADKLKRDYERKKLASFAGELGYAIKIGDRNQLVGMMKSLLRDLGEME